MEFVFKANGQLNYSIVAANLLPASCHNFLASKPDTHLQEIP
jgi:hypothetical protein